MPGDSVRKFIGTVVMPQESLPGDSEKSPSLFLGAQPSHALCTSTEWILLSLLNGWGPPI